MVGNFSGIMDNLEDWQRSMDNFPQIMDYLGGLERIVGDLNELQMIRSYYGEL